MSESTEHVTHLVNCTQCDYWSVQPTISNADLARDQHELGMFNWRPGGSEPCGPCVIACIDRRDLNQTSG